MSTQDFINSIKDAAISLHQKGGMFASVTIAQAVCESASGTSGLTKISNNLFGIKGEHDGNSTTYQTKEWVNGAYVSTYARFRKYPSFADSLIDHDNFIKSVKLNNGLLRYAPVLSASTPTAACQALHDCGYATSPTYAKTLTDIIDQYNLTQYDTTPDIDVDGIFGVETITRWQQVMGTPDDGVISPVSTLIKAVQTFLNASVNQIHINNMIGSDQLDVDGKFGDKTKRVLAFYLSGQDTGAFDDTIVRLLQIALNRATIGSNQF